MLAPSFKRAQATWRGSPRPRSHGVQLQQVAVPTYVHLRHPVYCPPFWGQRLSVFSN